MISMATDKKENFFPRSSKEFSNTHGEALVEVEKDSRASGRPAAGTGT